MTLAPIAGPTHRLARFARRKHTDTKPDGSIVVTFAAFLWTKTAPDDHGLSVNWLNYYAGDMNAQLVEVRSSMHMTAGPRDRLAILEIGKLTTNLQSTASLNLSILHDPIGPTPKHNHPNPSHAVIAGLPDQNLNVERAQEVAIFIANDSVIDLVPAKASQP